MKQNGNRRNILQVLSMMCVHAQFAAWKDEEAVDKAQIGNLFWGAVMDGAEGGAWPHHSVPLLLPPPPFALPPPLRPQPPPRRPKRRPSRMISAGDIVIAEVTKEHPIPDDSRDSAFSSAHSDDLSSQRALLPFLPPPPPPFLLGQPPPGPFFLPLPVPPPPPPPLIPFPPPPPRPGWKGKDEFLAYPPPLYQSPPPPHPFILPVPLPPPPQGLPPPYLLPPPRRRRAGTRGAGGAKIYEVVKVGSRGAEVDVPLQQDGDNFLLRSSALRLHDYRPRMTLPDDDADSSYLRYSRDDYSRDDSSSLVHHNPLLNQRPLPAQSATPFHLRHADPAVFPS